MKPKSLLLSFFMLILSISSSIAQEPKWSNTPVEIKSIDAQKALVMKADGPMSAIGEKMGEIYNTVFTYIQENNIQPAGPAFAVYHSFDPEGNIVFEAGVPIAEKVESTEHILCIEYPVMKAATTHYTGTYESVEPVYSILQKYMEDNKLESTGVSWEVYLTDPSKVKDPNMNQTLIYFPIK